jgi:menaquinone-specific isochorismate synthase
VRLTVRTRHLDEDRPLLDLPPVADALAWVRRGDGLVAWGTAVRIDPGAGPDRFARADAALRALAADATVADEVGALGTGLVGVGSFAFDDAAGGSVLVVPRVVVGRRDGVTWCTTIDPDGAPRVAGPRADPPAEVRRDRPRYAGSTNPDVHWLDAVATAVERIRAGELDKVVLARDHGVWSREPFDALDLARRLTARFPRCHTFVVEGLVGATPELLVGRRGDAVVSRALAGTVGRSDDEVEDATLGAAAAGLGEGPVGAPAGSRVRRGGAGPALRTARARARTAAAAAGQRAAPGHDLPRPVDVGGVVAGAGGRAAPDRCGRRHPRATGRSR